MTSIRDAFDKVGVTPEGIYCLPCGKNFKISTWSRHFREDHPGLTFQKQSKFAPKIEARIALARAEDDRAKYAKVPHSISALFFCFGCAKAFSDRGNYHKHCSGIASPCASTPKQTLQCYELLDGRFYPVDPPIDPS